MKDAKDIFCEAMLQLLQKKPFEEIKVKDLLERAGLNKSSYYYHFSSLEEVVERIIEQFTAELGQGLSVAAGELGDYSVLEKEYLSWRPFWDTALENRRTYIILRQSTFARQLMVRMQNKLMEVAKSYRVVCTDAQGRRYIPARVEQEFFWSAQVHQMLSILEVWAQHGFEESSEDICTIIGTVLLRPTAVYSRDRVEKEALPVLAWNKVVDEGI